MADVERVAHARCPLQISKANPILSDEANSSHTHPADLNPTNCTMLSPRQTLRGTWERAKTAPMDCGSDPEVLPRWLDVDKFAEGRAFYRKYFFSVVTAALCGLLVLFAEPVTVTALSHTGRSSTKRKAFQRYLSTLLYMDRWYKGHLWDSNDPARRSLLSVRQIHARVAQHMSRGTDRLLQEATSQYGMYLTQFSFVGFIALWPHGLGIKATPRELEGFIHFWRGTGYLLGIEDQYNLCTSLEDSRNQCRQLVDEVLRPSQTDPPPKYNVLSRALFEGMNMMVPGLDYDAFRAYTFDLLGHRYDFPVKGFSAIIYHVLRFLYGYLLTVPLFRVFFNFLLRAAICFTCYCNPGLTPESKYTGQNNNYSVSS